MSNTEREVIKSRLLIYLSGQKLIEGNSFTFESLCDIYIDHCGYFKPLRVTNTQFIYQLYKKDKLPKLPTIGVLQKLRVKIANYQNNTKVSTTDTVVVSTPKPKPLTKKQQYARDLRTDEWLAKRHEILERDGKRCQLCDDNRGLQVHHKKYIDGLKAWEYENRLLITLCHKCHKKFHNK